MTDSARNSELGYLLEAQSVQAHPDALYEACQLSACAADEELSSLGTLIAGNAQEVRNTAFALIGTLQREVAMGNESSARLDAIERLAMAQLGIQHLAQPARGPLEQLSAFLSDALTKAEHELPTYADLARFVAIAPRRIETLCVAVAPWTWLRDVPVNAWLTAGDQAARNVAEIVTAGLLPESQLRLASARLSEDAHWREVLRMTIVEASKAVWCTRYRTEWSLDVARNASELNDAKVLLRIGLPYPERELEVRQHAEGTWWRLAASLNQLVPFSQESMRWRVLDLGEFETGIHVSDPSSAADMWHGVTSLMRVADGEGGPRGVDIATAVAQDLCAGSLGEALVEGHNAFEEGEATSPELEDMVRHAFRARVLLPSAMFSLSERDQDLASLGETLAEIDDTHEAHSSATYLIQRDEYEDLLEDVPIALDAWWGRRMGAERRVPRQMVEGTLSSIGINSNVGKLIPIGSRTASSSAVPFNVPSYTATGKATGIGLALAAATDGIATMLNELRTAREGRAAELSDQLVQDLAKAPCAWLRSNLKKAYEVLRSERPERAAKLADYFKLQPGRVAVLMHDIHGRGVVGELRVTEGDPRSSEQDLWSRAPELQRSAREVIRAAYRAAASTTPLGAPPIPFAHHRLQLLLPHESAWEDLRPTVDGRSLGLAAAIAFASCWLDKPPRDNVAASASVEGNRLGRVEGLPAKVRALIELTGNSGLRLLVATQDEDQARSSDMDVVPCADVSAALRAADLNLEELDLEFYGSTTDREEQLDRLARDVQRAALTKYGETTTWPDIADRIERLIASLKDEKGIDRNLDRDRCLAALAYTHAGDPSSTSRMLRGVDRPDSEQLDVRALYDIAAVGSLIDQLRLDTDEGRLAVARLETSIAELRSKGATFLIGRAIGTLGRAYMHTSFLERALPNLREAVEFHALHEPQEVARSRVYLSMALRMGGDPSTALEQLDLAEDELVKQTRRYSDEYETACRMFLLYERSRVMLALERFDDSIRNATAALAHCGVLWWPSLGILRTRAWALRMRGRVAEADTDVNTMRTFLAKDVPPSFRDFANELIEEATGYPSEGGEVY